MIESPSVLMWVRGTRFHDVRKAIVPCALSQRDGIMVIVNSVIRMVHVNCETSTESNTSIKVSTCNMLITRNSA